MATPPPSHPSQPPSVRYRVLVWGLLLFCLSFALVGGILAERLIPLLHCQPLADRHAAGCSFLQHALVSRLAPFLSADTPLDYPFLLLRGFWGLILLWLIAIGFSRHADQNPPKLTAIARALAAKARSFSQTVHPFLQASFWILLVGLILFCIAFGTPFLGTYVSREILHALNCNPGTFDPMTSACMSTPGFWAPRLSPFLLPFLGQLGSPLWLFWQFGDVLLGWCAAIGVVYVLKTQVARRMTLEVA